MNFELSKSLMGCIACSYISYNVLGTVYIRKFVSQENSSRFYLCFVEGLGKICVIFQTILKKTNINMDIEDPTIGDNYSLENR